MTTTACICSEQCISRWDNQPCDCFCDWGTCEGCFGPMPL